MGVAGCGKSTIGKAVAKRCAWPFLEGDDFHPPANVAKMSAGTPLDNDDRAPWVAAMCTALDEEPARNVVLSCSSLSRAVRDWLRAGTRREVVFLWLKLDRETVRQRLAGRRRHFFKESMVDSQFAALDVPDPEESVITIDARRHKKAVINALVEDFSGYPV